MTPVKSRLLSRLDASIAAARDPAQAACLAAERAALLARMGHFDEALAELAMLRARAAAPSSPALAVWLCLADGMVQHARGQAAAARDRIQRAYALAAAARLRPLIALGAAWLAHTDHAQDDLPALARHVAEALQEAEPGHHAARARAALVAAQGYHWAGRAERARPWYRLAHEHATAEGDDTTISALLAERAWIGGQQARMASIFGTERFPADAAALRHAQLGAESAEHFALHAGHAAGRPLAAALRAQLLVAQGRHDEALGALQRHLASAEANAGAAADAATPALQADLAWCLAHLGRPDDALASARDAAAGVTPDGPADARAAVHGRLSQVFTALGLPADAVLHAERAQAALEALGARQAQLVSLLDAALKQVSDVPRAPARV